MADGTALSGAASGAAAGSSLGPWGALAGGVIGLLGAGSGSDAAAQAQAQNIAFQQQVNMQNDPFAATGQRAQYVPMLNALAQGGPAAIMNDPTFLSMNQQSMGNLTRQFAASDLKGSGNALNALMTQQNQNAMGYWQTMLQTYAGLSGANQPLAGVTGQSPQAAYNQAMGTQAAYGSAFGSMISGLNALFGSGASPAPSPVGYSEGGYTGSATVAPDSYGAIGNTGEDMASWQLYNMANQ
jgi:hypothetical protein